MKQIKRIDQLSNLILELGLGAAKTTFTTTASDLTIDKKVNVQTPTEATHATTKAYVDQVAGVVAVQDDGVAAASYAKINLVDDGSLVKAAVTADDTNGAVVVTFSHAAATGGDATGNTGAKFIQNVTKTAEGHITDVASVEITPALIGAQPAEATLTSIGAAGTGLVAKTTEGVVTPREIVGEGAVTVTNGNGVAGNPSIKVEAATTEAAGIVALANEASEETTKAATPAAVKAATDGKVNRAGDTMEGALKLHTNAPTEALEAASKGYVDSVAQGINIHDAVRVATTENLAALSGLQTVDGVTLQEGDRVLVMNQANSAENGVYVAATGAWTRAEDCNEGAELTSFYVFVLEGVANGGFGYTQTAKVGTVGTDAQTWVVFNKPAEYEVKETGAIVVTQEGRSFTVGVKAATTAEAGVVQLNDTVTSESTTQAATANAVKTVADRVGVLEQDAITKVEGAVADHIATLNADGTVKDSGAVIAAADAAIADNKTSAALVSSKHVADYVDGKVADNVSGAELKTLKLDLATASVTSQTSLPAGSVIHSCNVVVTTAYSAGATIAAAVGGAAIMDTTWNDPTQAGNYEGEGSLVTTSEGTVSVTIGGAPAAGAGYVIVTYSTKVLA